MVASPALERCEVSPPEEPPTRPRPGLLVVGLAVTLVVVVVVGTLLGAHLRSARQIREATGQDRTAVLAAAQRFTETWNTFEATDAAAYVERVGPLLTTKFRADFTGATDDVVAGIEQQGLSSAGRVLADGEGVPLVGIGSLDADSARVLVVADADRVSNGQQVLRHWRWQVRLVKVDGTWLVDSFDEV